MATDWLEDRLAGVRGMSGASVTDAPSSSVCIPCKNRGHVCFAQKIVDGEAWCIFCLDDQPCLWEQKKLPTKPKMKKAVETAVETEGVIMAVEGAERASSSNPEKPKKSSENGHGNGSTPQAERICAKPG